mmetsp:Transcript_34715/g.51798  ORF Transcript_34715/g.51798 Transcript_34715/m.51798 type:complete len:89 (-) Transcript_34715:134-400(-)
MTICLLILLSFHSSFSLNQPLLCYPHYQGYTKTIRSRSIQHDFFNFFYLSSCTFVSKRGKCKSLLLKMNWSTSITTKEEVCAPFLRGR